jgi:hypothetical protein
LSTAVLAGNARSAPVELGRTTQSQIEEQQFKAPNFNGWDPLAADSPWFRALRADISDEPADPASDMMLKRLRDANGHLDAQWSGPWTPEDWNWYTFPFQVVSGDIAPLSIPGTWAYNPETNGPYFLPPEPVVHEGANSLTYATEQWAGGSGDHHLLVYVRDEATGGFKELWEYYQPWVTRTGGAISAVAGASWRRFDLKNGENPAADTNTADAAGLPIAPLLVRYEEVANNRLNHAIRFAVNNSDISPTFKWPARTAAGAWNAATGMPYGTRLRLKKTWWDANADSVLGVGTNARVIGEAMRKHGLILADGSGGSSIQIGGAADLRWDRDLIQRLSSIPVAAFEVVQTPPFLRIDGPRMLAVGQEGAWTLAVQSTEPPLRAGTSINILDAAAHLVKYQFTMIDEAHRSVTARFTFTTPGVYEIRPYSAWNTGFGRTTVTVIDPTAAPDSNAQSGPVRAVPNTLTEGGPVIHFENLPLNASVDIFSILGEPVRRLPGENWDGTFEDGRRAPSGAYLARVAAPGGADEIIRLMLVW